MQRVKWKIGDATHDFSERGWIMGIVNVTPDSFFDGGIFFDHGAAEKRARELAEAGAEIIDIGGESTRPGAMEVGAEEEIARVLPVIKNLASSLRLSIDTSKAGVARAALAAGAKIVNDVTGGGDAEMWSLVAERDCAWIIMHMQGNPRTMQRAPKYHDVVAEVGDFFRQQYERALTSGIAPMRLAFDPGIGFGKTPAQNLSLLQNLPRLRVEDCPLVVGVSRKSFLAKISGNENGDRLPATVAFTSLLRAHGADVIRVHDVAPNLEALRVADAWRTPG